MAATIDWHPSIDSVLVMQIKGDPTLDELVQVTQKESEYIVSASQVIDTIVDTRKLGKVPQGFLGLMPKIAAMPAAKHKNAGRKIVVGVSGAGGALLSIFSKLYHKLYFFPTMQDAEEFLA